MAFPYEFTFEFPEAAQPPQPILIPRGPAAQQFVRGMKFANVPGGRADMVSYGGDGRVPHVNTVENIHMGPASVERNGMYSGVVKFRFRNYKRFPVPQAVNK